MDWPGIHSVCVHPREPRDVVLGVSCGGVWLTADGGATWTLGGEGLRAEYLPPELARDPIAQDVHRLGRCAADPRVLWLQHHNGIFRSTDGGRLVVTLTRDGGSTFESLLRGLPQTHTYDLVYRHAMDVDADGETLCIASTTGNLWISEDAGESWVAVSTHLPPVYAARFAPG